MPSNVAPTSAPAAAPTSAPASANTSTPSAPEIPSTSDLFDDYAKSVGLGGEEMSDFSNTRTYEDKSVEDFLGEEPKSDEDPTTGSGNEETAPETAATPEDPATGEKLLDSVEDKSKPLYEFKGKIGEKDRQLTIKTPEQMDKVIKRALVAEDLHKRNQEFQGKIEELSGKAEAMDRFDALVEKDPVKVLNSILEDLPEDQVKEWLVNRAEWIGRPEQEKALDRAERRAQEAERAANFARQEMERISSAKKQAAIEADRNTVSSWKYGIEQKLTTKLPEEYHGIIRSQMQNTLEVARARAARGEQVSIKWIDQHFTQNVKPIVDLIKSRSNPETVNKKVGEVLAGQKQDNLRKVQTIATNTKPVNQDRNALSKKFEENPSSIFDHFSDLISQGKATLR